MPVYYNEHRQSLGVSNANCVSACAKIFLKLPSIALAKLMFCLLLTHFLRQIAMRELLHHYSLDERCIECSACVSRFSRNHSRYWPITIDKKTDVSIARRLRATIEGATNNSRVEDTRSLYVVAVDCQRYWSSRTWSNTHAGVTEVVGCCIE